MVYCQKCGTEVSEEMAFCPKCGAPLKAPVTQTGWRGREEKAEKNEKNEKNEKGEKNEKRERPFLGPLIGGVVLLFLGLISLLSSLGYRVSESAGAFLLIILGLVIVFVALVRMARRRNPSP